MVKEGIVLGHVISKKEIEVDKAKVDLIVNLSPPKLVKEIRSFLGHAGFYRRFIKNFSILVQPLINLLVKDVKFDFTFECLNSFEHLKKVLTGTSNSDQQLGGMAEWNLHLSFIHLIGLNPLNSCVMLLIMPSKLF